MVKESRPGAAVVWTVLCHASAVLRPCPRCNEVRPFVSTGKFRVNANGRRLDVWLLYQCGDCAESWRLPVYERVQAAALDPERYDAFLRNDPEEAARCAADRGLLQRAGARLDGGEVAVTRPPLVLGAPLSVVLRLTGGRGPRLDQLVARELGVSRAAVARWGLLGWVESERALPRAVIEGQRVWLSAAALAEATRA